MGYVKQQILKEQQTKEERKLHLDSFDMHRQVDENYEPFIDCTPEEVDTDEYYSCNISEQEQSR